MKSFLVLLAAIAVAGCSVFGLGDDSLEGRLRTQKRAWLRQDIRDYFYDYQALCFCGNVDPILIEVRDNVVTAASNKITGQAIPLNQRNDLRTIPDLYDYLIDAAGRADEMRADFDEQLHVPTYVHIDFERNAADDELVIKTSNLLIIESLRQARAASPATVVR